MYIIIHTYFYSVIKIIVFNVIGNCHEHFFFYLLPAVVMHSIRYVTYTRALHHKYMKRAKMEVFCTACRFSSSFIRDSLALSTFLGFQQFCFVFFLFVFRFVSVFAGLLFHFRLFRLFSSFFFVHILFILFFMTGWHVCVL